MNLGLAIYASREVTTDSIIELSNELKEHYDTIDFGKGIQSVSIGIICVSKNFEPFFKQRKPKYTKDKKETEIDGIKITIEKAFEYDCKIVFEQYQEADSLGKKQLLAAEILKTTKEIFEKKKINDFKENKFVEDLEIYFKNQGYLQETLT
ncbi:hypothetical protein [Poritiphilus flavus]|uniref:Immunity protein 44 n=1 Tax=Poritiphilus flavus TaxID=2697053 RepID=A0A6L9EDW2_9FLAO|nr:hypothetical protein [Poritiphilus flavus]NAS12905.1 hypothetical protein [Poritiphilus flavus]